MADIVSYSPPLQYHEFQACRESDSNLGGSDIINAELGGDTYPGPSHIHAARNSARIRVPSALAGCNIAEGSPLTSVYWYELIGGDVGFGSAGGNLIIRRTRGFGIPARFTVQLIDQYYEDFVLVSETVLSTGTLSLGSTDLQSTSSIALSADTVTVGPPHRRHRYFANIIKAEVPWINP